VLIHPIVDGPNAAIVTAATSTAALLVVVFFIVSVSLIVLAVSSLRAGLDAAILIVIAFVTADFYLGITIFAAALSLQRSGWVRSDFPLKGCMNISAMRAMGRLHATKQCGHRVMMLGHDLIDVQHRST
jgi:hypothetical protein